VLAHARALMTSAPGGACSFIDADVGDPTAILAGARETLDFGRPVAVLLLSTLAHIHDTAKARAIVRTLAGPLASGSHVAIYHTASDLDPSLRKANRRGNQWPTLRITLRSRAEVASLVAGLDLVPPGLVPISDWRPEPDDPHCDDVVPVYGVVARRP